MSWSNRVARLATRIAPPSRRDWSSAVEAELAHLPASERLGFALGGLSAAIGWRVSDAPTLAVVTRTVLVLGAVLWAGLLGRLALNLIAVDQAFASAIALLSLAFGLGAILTARWGLAVAVRAGTPLLVVACAYAMLGERLTPSYPYLRYCQALSVEIAAILAVGLGLAALVLAYGKRVRRS